MYHEKNNPLNVLNPKSRKGKKTMNYNYQQEMAEILQKAQRDIMYKAMDAVQKRNTQILNLLENGMGILEQTSGDRFQRIIDQRRKLWIKMEENSKTIGTLWNILNTECVMI